MVNSTIHSVYLDTYKQRKVLTISSLRWLSSRYTSPEAEPVPRRSAGTRRQTSARRPSSWEGRDLSRRKSRARWQ